MRKRCPPIGLRSPICPTILSSNRVEVLCGPPDHPVFMLIPFMCIKYYSMVGHIGANDLLGNAKQYMPGQAARRLKLEVARSGGGTLSVDTLLAELGLEVGARVEDGAVCTVVWIMRSGLP